MPTLAVFQLYHNISLNRKRMLNLLILIFRKKRRKLAKRVPKREHISTTIKSDIERAKRRR